MQQVKMTPRFTDYRFLPRKKTWKGRSGGEQQGKEERTNATHFVIISYSIK